MLAAGLLANSGCGGDETDSVKLTQISGKVMFNNKPLEGATIAFVPEAGAGVTTPGRDVTGVDGSFNAKYRNRMGLGPGKYKVIITKADSSGGGGQIADDPYMAKLAQGGAAAAVDKGLPLEYGDTAKTPLGLDVVSGQAQTDLLFEVKGNVPAATPKSGGS